MHPEICSIGILKTEPTNFNSSSSYFVQLMFSSFFVNFLLFVSVLIFNGDQLLQCNFIFLRCFFSLQKKKKSLPIFDSTKKNSRQRHRSVYNRENVLEVNEKSCKHDNRVYWRADFHEGKEFEVDRNDVNNEPI